MYVCFSHSDLEPNDPNPSQAHVSCLRELMSATVTVAPVQDEDSGSLQTLATLVPHWPHVGDALATLFQHWGLIDDTLSVVGGTLAMQKSNLNSNTV